MTKRAYGTTTGRPPLLGFIPVDIDLDTADALGNIRKCDFGGLPLRIRRDVE